MTLILRASFASLLVFVGCTKVPEPSSPLSVAPAPVQLKHLPSAFPLACLEEGAWSAERMIGRSFAKEGDFYRAITAFKRAEILLPPSAHHRVFELQYDVFLCYCLAQRWSEALAFYRSSSLNQIPADFPARRDLFLLVQETLLQTGDVQGAARIDRGLSAHDLEVTQLTRPLALRTWDEVPSKKFQEQWKHSKLNPHKAAFLQAIFPGAGYWYVGQVQSGVTSFFLNALTAAATATLAAKHQWAAAFLVGSLEMGWYLGGINGASRAAHQWNRQLGERLAYPILNDEKKATLFRLEFFF
jgi:hypothetical protein